MALWVCLGCTAAYSVGAPRCPQCGSTERREDGEDMAKVTVHGGATNADAPEGGEDVSAGSSSETSSDKESSKPQKSAAARRKPARTTESPSPKGRTDSSSADGTDGGQTAATPDGDAS